MKIPKKSYDICIIGAGLSGWTLARALSQNTNYRIALLEGQPEVGGRLRSHPSSYGNLGHGLKILPAGEATAQALDFLANIFGKPIQYDIFDASPVTFEKGEFIPFVGFGDEAPAEVDVLGPYLKVPQWRPTTPSISDWIDRLKAGFMGDLYTQAEVTRFQVENGSVKSILVNGDKHFESQNFIFTGAIKDLLRLLPLPEIAPKLVSKVSKATSWTAISLDLVHASPVTDSPATHLLRGTGENALPVLGLFHPPSPEGHQLSQWLCFLGEESEGEENQGTAIREMKRQIRRAFPQSLDSLKLERLLVTPSTHRHLGWKDEKGLNFPNISNLYVASGDLAIESNCTGALLRSKIHVDFFVEKDRAQRPKPQSEHESPALL